jgi:hypothetical protein
VVRNLGNVPADFKARFYIGAHYVDSLAHLALAPGDSILDSFVRWVPNIAGTFALQCTVDLAGDSVTANNCITRPVTVYVQSGVSGEPAGVGRSEFALGPSPSPGRRASLLYCLPEPVLLSARLYDTTGRLARVVVERRPTCGRGTVAVDAHGLAPGVYTLCVWSGGSAPAAAFRLVVR